MEVLQATQIAIKNILFATDFEAPASRALPFAVAMANRYGARLYVSHVIPREAYACASPETVDRVLKEVGDFAAYTLTQIVDSLQQHGLRCDAVLGEGNITETIKDFVSKYSADLVVVGSSRAGWGKAVLGSVAEEIIRESPCPVLTVGPRVTSLASSGVQCVICATDFSPASIHAVEFAVSLAEEYQAHLTVLHVLEGRLPTSFQFGVEFTERRLRQALPTEVDLRFKPELVVEMGSVADRIVNLTADLSGDIIIMGSHGAGALSQMVSRLGSIVHKVVSLAPCPVLTVGDVQRLESR
jgi:nucleotide-binding universal stress UspA family protein